MASLSFPPPLMTVAGVYVSTANEIKRIYRQNVCVYTADRTSLMKRFRPYPYRDSAKNVCCLPLLYASPLHRLNLFLLYIVPSKVLQPTTAYLSIVGKTKRLRQYREYRFFPSTLSTTRLLESNKTFVSIPSGYTAGRRRLHCGFYNTTYGNSRLIATLNVIFSVIHRTLKRGVSE